LAERDEIPVRAGAEGPLAELYVPLAFPDYWPETIEPRPARPGEALELLEASAEEGATIVAIGPYTNLAMLEAARPGLLASTEVVVMGGHVTTPREGLPPWGIKEDFNVQQDRFAAAIVLKRCRPVVVPVAVALEVCLRQAHVDRLRAAGPLGAVVADQGEMHARDNNRAELGRAYDRLPDDLLNFHYDPLACAVGLGWDGVDTEEIPTRVELGGGMLSMVAQDGEPPLRAAA
jgi:inosine-uridine nucleoside N-ribohydrolase